MGACNPEGNDKLVTRLAGCLWLSWRLSKVKLTTSRTSRIFENGGVVVVVFFWCIKDQCGVTFDQGNSLIISWNCAIKLSEAFWCAPGLENYVCALRYFAPTSAIRQILYLATERNVIWRRESARVIDPLSQMKREYNTIWKLQTLRIVLTLSHLRALHDTLRNQLLGRTDFKNCHLC